MTKLVNTTYKKENLITRLRKQSTYFRHKRKRKTKSIWSSLL